MIYMCASCTQLNFSNSCGYYSVGEEYLNDTISILDPYTYSSILWIEKIGVFASREIKIVCTDTINNGNSVRNFGEVNGKMFLIAERKKLKEIIKGVK